MRKTYEYIVKSYTDYPDATGEITAQSKREAIEEFIRITRYDGKAEELESSFQEVR